jgi:hypothetical protein
MLSGERVRVAPDDGPAVVGLLPPEIVVPRWLVEAPEDRRRMAVEHEREHLRGGDPYLLALGWAVTALLPWNPMVWWMHMRLRVAVELDCDRRVLRRGVTPRAYGSFLIDAAELGAGRLQGAVSLIRSRSTLKRRLGEMTKMSPKFAGPRAVMVAALGIVALVAACEPRLPTQAEVDEMDAAKAEQFMAQAGLAEIGEAAYYVDGVEATTEEAQSYTAEQVARVEVVKGQAGPAVYIYTKDAPRVDASAGSVVSRISPRDGLVEVKEPAGGSGGGTVSVAEFDGLIIVDGEVREDLDLSTIDKLTIQSIEIVKGEAAKALYSQPEAANGVILITTKR